MNDQEKQIKCAEILGWKWYRRPATGPWADKPMRALYHPQLVPEYIAELKEADMTEKPCNHVFLIREGLIGNYLTDAKDALELVEWMRKKGWCSDVHCGRDGKWNIHFWKLNEWARKEGPVGFGHSFCEAIVNAFLRANGVEI